MALLLSTNVADSLQWSSIALVVLCVLLCIPYAILYFKAPTKNVKFLGVPITRTPRKTKIAFYVAAAAAFIGVVGVILGILSTQRGTIMGEDHPIDGEDQYSNLGETFANENGQSGVRYTNVGYGPLVSKNHINNWIRGGIPGAPSGFSFWKDPNGMQMDLPSDAFKSIYGFIPPSFEYFPAGQDPSGYNGENYELGRQKCLDACTLTNCTAVQTEVPQNCFHQTVQIAEPTGPGSIPTPGEYENNCIDQASHACTLYYNNIQDADDAYWTINDYFGNGQTGGCQGTDSEGNNLIGCMGRKYYEDTDPGLPQLGPIQIDGTPVKPSESPVKWCDNTVTAPNSGSFYGGEGCTCTTQEDCTDSKCCRWRDMLTTESLNNQKPYYNLPIALEALDDDPVQSVSWSKLVKAVNIDKNGIRHCCGLCPSDEYFRSEFPEINNLELDTNPLFSLPSAGTDDRMKTAEKGKQGILPWIIGGVVIGGVIGTSNGLFKSNEWNEAQNTDNVPDADKVLKSCYPDKCTSPDDRECWVIDRWAPTEPCPYTNQAERDAKCSQPVGNVYCNGDPYNKDSDDAAQALRDFANAFRPEDKKKAYNPLMTSCFYRNAAAVGSIQQYNCPTNEVSRGCYGSPPIISIENLTGPAGACSNDSIIPQSARCTLPKDAEGRPINNGVCTDFPYSCDTQFGSNRLWMPVKE